MDTTTAAPASDGVIGFRIFAMVTIVLVKVGFGSAPLYFRNNLRFLSVSNAFAAGVFLAGGLTHLLPEAVGAFAKLAKLHSPDEHETHDHHHHEHCEADPTPYALCALGFLLTFYLEKVMLARPEDQHGHAGGDGEGGGHSHAHDNEVIIQFAALPSEKRSIMPVVLTAVLSIHSVVSGMALGVQEDKGKAMLVYLAIISHKWVEAFSLGTNIVKATGANVAMMARLLAAFACSSPLGVLLGWGIQSALAGSAAQQATAVLDAAASGTFIYIAVIDTLAEEFSNGIDKNRCVCVCVLLSKYHS